MFFDFQSWICMPVSASDESELHLYIPEVWTWQSSSANDPSSFLYYSLKYLESFISVPTTAFQHASLIFFAGFEPVVNNLRRLRCPS
jgi:hypothetical protein